MLSSIAAPVAHGQGISGSPEVKMRSDVCRSCHTHTLAAIVVSGWRQMLAALAPRTLGVVVVCRGMAFPHQASAVADCYSTGILSLKSSRTPSYRESHRASRSITSGGASGTRGPLSTRVPVTRRQLILKPTQSPKPARQRVRLLCRRLCWPSALEACESAAD